MIKYKDKFEIALVILSKMMAKLTWIFLILFFSNILTLKIFYLKHFLKQNPELVNASFSIKNGRLGMLISYYLEIKTRLDFFWVNKRQITKNFFF
jgi:hypothetical protein